MDEWLRVPECSCNRSSVLSPSNSKPPNKYFYYLLDEFEKCTQQNSDLTKIRKEHQQMKKELCEAQRDIRDLKFEKQLITEKVAALQRELQEQKLLHTQLRDEASSELRGLFRKAGNHEKDVDLMKYQLKMSAKRYALDLENMRWELTTNRKYDQSFIPSGIDDLQSSENM